MIPVNPGAGGAGTGQWHANDAEPLPKEYADAFPQFDAGDLLISFRNINLVFVASPTTGEIKWCRGWSAGHVKSRPKHNCRG